MALKELKRLWPQLVVIAVAFLVCDPSGSQLVAAAYRLSMLSLIVIVVHVGRKALFPYIDLETFTSKAKTEATGAGLVWLGTCIFLSMFMYLAMVQ